MIKSVKILGLFILFAKLTMAQTFDWGPMQMDAQEVKKFKIKQVKATMKKAGEQDKSYYYSFDKNGFVSAITDTVGRDGKVNTYKNFLDDEGRLVRKVMEEENTMTVEWEKNIYQDGKLKQRMNELFYPMQYAVITDYLYQDDLLVEERITFDANVLSRSFYFYAGQKRVDSIHHFSYNRRDSLLEHRSYFAYNEDGKPSEKLILYITGDTIEYEKYDALNRVIYHQEMSSETDMDRSVFHYARKSYKYRGNLLTEERFINDTYLDKSGKKEVFVSRYAYDDKEKLLAIIRPGYETNLRYETTKDGEIRYSISGADTTEVLIKSNDRGLRKEVSITYPGVPLKSTVLSTTKVFNKDGEVMRRAKLISGKTERCETSYTYNGDKYIESEKCLQLGEHDDPPFSIERLTKYYDTGGQVVKELMESKAFNENSNPKAQYEKTFTYDEGGKLLIESNKNLKRKDARDEFITYTYNADGQLISNKRFQGEVIEGKEYAEESYDYEKGKLKVMRFSPKTAQMAYMFPPKHTIYLPNGKTERVITYDQQGKEAILLNLTYTRKGLCTNQRISEYGKLKVMLEYAYEFY